MKVFVGWDSREDIAYQVCKHSILSKQPNAEVIPLKQNELRDQGLYWRDVDKLASTEFTFTRFLIPELAHYQGWAKRGVHSRRVCRDLRCGTKAMRGTSKTRGRKGGELIGKANPKSRSNSPIRTLIPNSTLSLP